MPEPTKPPENCKQPSISAQRLYHLLMQFHSYHDVYYKTKAEELAAATRVARGRATEEEVKKYKKFEKNKLRANWFTAVCGFAHILLGELSLDPDSEKYKDFLERIEKLKILIDTRRGTGILVSDVSDQEADSEHKIKDADVEFAEELIKEMLQEYAQTKSMGDVDALMQEYPIE